MDSVTATPTQIKATRLNAGLSVVAMAALMGVSRQTVHSWENGNHPINPRDWAYMLSKVA